MSCVRRGGCLNECSPCGSSDCRLTSAAAHEDDRGAWNDGARLVDDRAGDAAGLGVCRERRSSRMTPSAATSRSIQILLESCLDLTRERAAIMRPRVDQRKMPPDGLRTTRIARRPAADNTAAVALQSRADGRDCEIYDTTLRDGTQGEGRRPFRSPTSCGLPSVWTPSASTTSRAAGPASNPKDIEFFEQAKRRTFRRARLAAFGSTRRKRRTRVEDDDQVRLLLDAEHAGRHDLRQDVAAARPRSAADDAEENLAMIARHRAAT